MIKLILQVLAAGAGTIGFSLLFGVPSSGRQRPRTSAWSIYACYLVVPPPSPRSVPQ